MKKSEIYIFLISGFILAGCAKIVPLSGGDQDRTAPRIKKASPDTFATGFTGDEIKIQFDEYISLDDPTRNILFSPSLENEPKIVAQPKGISIKLNEKLKPNTTYTVRLQQAIKDLNEGNLLQNEYFVFSTGDHIDSGKVVGLILQYDDNAPVKDVMVGLYPVSVPHNEIRKTKPEFWTRTQADGSFEIPFVRKDSFHIYAIKEEDNSFMYDREGESIAFMEQALRSDSLMMHQLFLFSAKEDSLKLLKSKYYGDNRFSFTFSKPLKQIEVSMQDSLGKVDFVSSMPGTDSLVVWSKNASSADVSFFIQSEEFSDTLRLKMREPKRMKSNKLDVAVLSPSPSMEMSLYDTLALQFNEPVLVTDSALVQLKTDSIPVPFRLFPDPKSPLRLLLHFKPLGGRKYDLNIEKGAFVKFSKGDSLDSLGFHFGFLRDSDYSELEIRLRNLPEKGPWIVSLTKDKKIVYKTTLNDGDTVLNVRRLAPGGYGLQAFVDRDNNGVISPGDFDTRKVPERLYILQKGLTIRRGFDQKTIWDFDTKQMRGK